MSKNVSVPFTFQILSLVVLLGLGVLLQIFLSKRESRIPGLVMPVISFVVSIITPMLMVVPENENGFFVEMFFAFILCNIPTSILLAIYFGCRAKKKNVKELDKMNIQDLD